MTPVLTWDIILDEKHLSYLLRNGNNGVCAASSGSNVSRISNISFFYVFYYKYDSERICTNYFAVLHFKVAKIT